MREGTLEQLIFLDEEFIKKYDYFQKTRFFYPDSVADFKMNKDIPTFLSNLIFLSNPNKRLFLFRNASLNKISEETYNINLQEEKFYAKIYSIEDETAEYPLFWPTSNSKIPHSISCDQFEIAKNFRGDFPSEILVMGFRNRKDYYIYHINFEDNTQKRKIFIKDFVLAKVNF